MQILYNLSVLSVALSTSFIHSVMCVNTTLYSVSLMYTARMKSYLIFLNAQGIFGRLVWYMFKNVLWGFF